MERLRFEKLPDSFGGFGFENFESKHDGLKIKSFLSKIDSANFLNKEYKLYFS